MYEKIELIAPSLHQSFTIRGRSLLDCFILNVHFVIPIAYFRQFRIVLSIVNIYIEIAVEVWLKVNHSHFRAVLVGILQFSSKLETKLKNMVLARCHQWNNIIVAPFFCNVIFGNVFQESQVRAGAGGVLGFHLVISINLQKTWWTSFLIC